MSVVCLKRVDLEATFSSPSRVSVYGNIPEYQVCWLIKCFAIRVKLESQNEDNAPPTLISEKRSKVDIKIFFQIRSSRCKKLKYYTLD